MEQYSNRVAAVFGALEPSLAAKTPSGMDQRPQKDGSCRRGNDQGVYIPPAKRTRLDDNLTSDHRGQRSREGKRQRLREDDERVGSSDRFIRRHRRVRGQSRREVEPDYVRNPSKWTKYDLKDDGSQVLRGMSQDQVNKYAAFQFLDEVKKRKESSGLEHVDEHDASNDECNDSSVSTKVVFKKPSKTRNLASGRQGNEDGESDEVNVVSNQLGLSGGVKMAEYVVGSKTAAQIHRERRRQQKKNKLVSLHSEEDDSEITIDSACHGESVPVNTSNVNSIKEKRSKSERVKSTKSSSAAVSLSHLAEEEEEI